MSTCTCRDHEAQQVAALVAQGVDQIEASRLIYTGGPVLGSSPAVTKAWVARVVTDLFAPLRKAVGLT